MPLPEMAGDVGSMMSGAGMQAGAAGPPQAPGSQGDSSVSPQEQARGAVEQVGKIRQSVSETLEAIASQFPTVSQSAQQLQQAINQGMQRLVKDIIKSIQTPEPEAPKILR